MAPPWSRSGAMSAHSRSDGPVAAVAVEGPSDLDLEHGHLPVVELDQVPQGLDPHGVGVGQGGLVEQGLGRPPRPGRSWARPRPPWPARTWIWGLEPRTQGHQLGPVADQLPQLSHLRRDDPGLGQAPEAQQVGQVGGVALAVLHPPVAPVVAERVGQVHPGPVGLEQVGGSVPAVGGLESSRASVAHLTT